jgi:SnoaL-like domain
MKKLIFSLILFAACGGLYAQTTAPKLTLERIHQFNSDIEKKPAETFQKYATEGFVFTNGNGKSYNKTELVAVYNIFIQDIHETSEEKIQQIGNTAIITGKIHQRFLQKTDRKLVNDYMGVLTYTFVFQNNNWMFAAAQHTDYVPPKTVEEAAIKSVLEAEATAFKQRNESKALNFWLNAPYISHYYTAPGLGYVRGDKLIATYKNFLKTNPEVDNSPTDYHDYIIRVNGNAAWATWISESIIDNKKVTVHRASYLEKANGEWKLCSVHSSEAK